MKIGVVGMGHFAGVVAVCLGSRGHLVCQTDEVPWLLRAGQIASEEEPGFGQAWARGGGAPDMQPRVETLAHSDLLWIAYDVPLDAAGAPVTTEILARIRRTDDEVPKSIPFLVSCQWPVGTTRLIAAQCPGREFVYVMENVRAGKAIADFQADPIPALGAASLPKGAVWTFVRNLATVKEPWCSSWETIEFAKHSLNAFLALQIAFVNELARIAPHDVNMADVTRVLKSDPRVSPLAPLTAGPKFGGGSLKRDLLVLERLNTFAQTPIINAILLSNGE